MKKNQANCEIIKRQILNEMSHNNDKGYILDELMSKETRENIILWFTARGIELNMNDFEYKSVSWWKPSKLYYIWKIVSIKK